MNEGFLRQDELDAPWPARPWIMALLCGLAGLAFFKFAEGSDDGKLALPTVMATAIAVATISFAITLERRRWWWAALFAAGWGLVIGLITLSTRRYGVHPNIFEYGFFAGITAVLLASPLFQAARDEGALRFPPRRVFEHAWTDAVIGAASLAFIGISFAMADLIASLFDLIGIHFLKRLMREGWFGWSLAGFAFGAASGLLRERDALVLNIQRLVKTILSILAPVLAAALWLFLLSLPLTGLAGLWDGWLSATALTLAAAGASYILINAVIGGADEALPANPVLRWSMIALLLAITPLALLAAAALGQRIGQYGWTPERIWGVLAVAVALAFGLIAIWCLLRDRMGFVARLRRMQVWHAVAVTVTALFLALPILDFGAMATRDQLARLRSGDVSATEFDWTAMAFDFGPAGRAALRTLARSGSADERRFATTALAQESRWSPAGDVVENARAQAALDAVRIEPGGGRLPAGAVAPLADTRLCSVEGCRVRQLADGRLLVVGRRGPGAQLDGILLVRNATGGWETRGLQMNGPQPDGGLEGPVTAARIELRPVTRQQLYVDGVLIGDIVD